MRKIMMSSLAMASLITVSACGESPIDENTAEETTGAETAATEGAAGTDAMGGEPVEAEVELTFAEITRDAVAGETVFGQCRACHKVEEDANGLGPSLYGVIGREAGSIDGFNYSDANSGSGITWTPEIMFDYLESPREYMPGTRMAFPGIKDAQDRADLVGYLETLGE